MQKKKLENLSPFNSAQKTTKKLTSNIKQTRLTKNKSSFTELPAIERNDFSYRDSNLKLK